MAVDEVAVTTFNSDVTADGARYSKMLIRRRKLNHEANSRNEFMKLARPHRFAKRCNARLIDISNAGTLSKMPAQLGTMAARLN
jgi:DNA-binding TFAR19-related protein (PDSD5 family)